MNPSPSPSTPTAATLAGLRELLRRMDPDAEVLIDEYSGEVLVRGDIDRERLDAAIREAGLSMRVAAPGGERCCGSCGCG
ncbi:hypothetical protein [Solilutibacter pythonis]|nr:hypothetical protein [Lysobacter pythonis]